MHVVRPKHQKATVVLLEVMPTTRRIFYTALSSHYHCKDSIPLIKSLYSPPFTFYIGRKVASGPIGSITSHLLANNVYVSLSCRQDQLEQAAPRYTLCHSSTGLPVLEMNRIHCTMDQEIDWYAPLQRA